jgi:anti-sigma regulatory factor (Ser/Thr protein kinase)
MTSQRTGIERIYALPATAAAAGMARRELAATSGIAGDVAYKALLMTSELIAAYVAEVVPDPTAKLRLSVRVTPERVRVEVGGRPPEVPLDALLHSRETPSLGGMGLHIVERMADAWGIVGDGDTMMWFELARPSAAAA